tara:strand:+ start:3438 stop:3581 length:144 start_codon:yes stop_codon:yes gene_type:complete
VKILLLEILSVIVFYKIMRFIIFTDDNNIEENLNKINKNQNGNKENL